MKTSIKYHAVNWTNGMKLNQSHFKEGDNHFFDVIRDVASTTLNSFNYGLLPPLEGQKSSLELSVYEHPSSHVEIILESCNIVSGNGNRLIFTPNVYGDRKPRLSIPTSDMSTDNASFYVVINGNPFDRIPIGTPDPEEIPLRHPNSYANLTLQLMSKRETNPDFMGAFQFIIGELNWQNQRFDWNENYIPPVTSLHSHPALINFLDQTKKIMNEIKAHSVTIIRKNSFGNPINNKLAQNTCRICDEILEFIATNAFEIKYILKEQPPIYFANKISLLANRINTFLLTIEDKQKEELLQYYHEWENIRPVDFESVLGELMELDYNHYDIRAVLHSIDKFLATLSVLWAKLSQLEYIGQHKDNIVIGEDAAKGTNVEKKLSFLD